jgi:hypothetical protein
MTLALVRAWTLCARGGNSFLQVFRGIGIELCLASCGTEVEFRAFMFAVMLGGRGVYIHAAYRVLHLLRSDVFRGIGIELRFTSTATEIERLAVVVAAVLGRCRVHGHAAYGILDGGWTWWKMTSV